MAHGEAQIHLLAAPRGNPNHAHAARGADAFIWVEALDTVLALADAAGLVPVRGPEQYDSSPVATQEVVYPDLDDHWICFGAVVA